MQSILEQIENYSSLTPTIKGAGRFSTDTGLSMQNAHA